MGFEAQEDRACHGVLVVEDEKDIRESLRLFLELEGFSTQSAADGQEALEVLSRLPMPQLILLDLMMPRMNGWEFAEIVKKDERTARCPIFVLSAYADRASGLPAGVVLKKPIDLDVMLEWVGRFVPRSEVGNRSA